MTDVHDLWVERFRPTKVDDYVWRDAAQKGQVLHWIEEGKIPNILLSGRPGTGKTTLARIILNELGVNKHDIMEINASHENSVDVMRDKISNFISTYGMGDYKFVLLDEADYLSKNAQAILRNMTESYSRNVRFIMTCNEKKKLMPALHSRFQAIEINALDRDEFMLRIANILTEVGIELTEDNVGTLNEYIEMTIPDMRKCINLLQQNCFNGRLNPPSELESVADHITKIVQLTKAGKVTEARKVLSAEVGDNDFEELYRYFYQNLSDWGDSEDQQNAAILIIADALVKHNTVADPEINCAACLVKLKGIVNG